MLLAAYLVFAISLVGIHFHTGNDHGDPSLQLVH